MTGLYAGLTAWAIELTIAFTFLWVLKLEEKKVIERRKKK
jgi:hypothetical protein